MTKGDDLRSRRRRRNLARTIVIEKLRKRRCDACLRAAGSQVGVWNRKLILVLSRARARVNYADAVPCS